MIEALDQAAIARGETVPDPEREEEDGEEEDDDVLGPRSTRGWHPSMCRRGPKWRFVKNLVDLLPVAPREIDSMHLDRLVPDNAQEARRRLALVIAEMIARLESIRATLMRVAQADAAAAAAGLMAESGKERELERRYSLSHGRLLLRTILELDKMRKSDSDGTLDHVEPNPDDAFIPDWTIPPTPQESPSEFSPAAPEGAHDAPPDTSQERPQGTDSHTSPPEQQVSCAIPLIVAQLVTQSLCGDKTCESAKILRSKANSSRPGHVPPVGEAEPSGRPQSDPARQGSPPAAREGLLEVVQQEPPPPEPEPRPPTITPGSSPGRSAIKWGREPSPQPHQSSFVQQIRRFGGSYNRGGIAN